MTMSDKKEKKEKVSFSGSLRKPAKSVFECKVSFIGKWVVGPLMSDIIMQTVKANITPNGGIKTKLRLLENGLKVGEKGSMFSNFPEQFLPITSVQSLARDEKNTNTIIIVARNDAQIYEVIVYRCPTEYEARQVVEEFAKLKGESEKHSDQIVTPQTATPENWSMHKTSTAKYPRAVIATAVNGMKQHDSQVRVDKESKTIHIQQQEPIYAKVVKRKEVTQNGDATANLIERVKLLEHENRRLRAFIDSHLVTSYQPIVCKETDMPIDALFLVEGNRATEVTNDPEYCTLQPSRNASFRSNSTYNSGANLGLNGHFERGSVIYQHSGSRSPYTGSMNGSVDGSNPQRDNIQTRFLVPAETLQKNLVKHTYVQRKINHVYRSSKGPITVKLEGPNAVEYQQVDESLPPRDSISSFSNSDIEENHIDDNAGTYVITQPTEVRYM